MMHYPTISSDDPKEILCHAAKIIEEYGWVQGNWESPDGVCIVGSLRAAVIGKAMGNTLAEYSSLDVRRINGAFKILSSRIFPDGDGSVTVWNDEPDRTKEEVLAVLKGDNC